MFTEAVLVETAIRRLMQATHSGWRRECELALQPEMPFPDLINGGIHNELENERRKDAAHHWRRGHIDHCDACGDRAISYISCRNRHCPKCEAQAREPWLAARERELLDVACVHVVFTLRIDHGQEWTGVYRPTSGLSARTDPYCCRSARSSEYNASAPHDCAA